MKNQRRFANHFSKIMIGMIVVVSVIMAMILFCGDAIAEPLNTADTITETTTTTTVTTTTMSETTTTDITTTTTTATSVSTTSTTTTETEETITTTEIPTIVIEMYKTESTTQVEEEPEYDYLFYAPSMRVHTPDCYYADESCMEAVYGDYIYNARKCTVCNPDITIEVEYIPEEETYSESSYGGYGESLEQNWTINEMTYYSGDWGCYGAAGTTLINNYSCACNSVPLGTILYIQSEDGSVDGYYRVDDRGGMGDNVVDIFYSDYSYTPSSFRELGRVSCSVWIAG